MGLRRVFVRARVSCAAMMHLAPLRHLVRTLVVMPAAALVAALVAPSATIGHADLVSADPAQGARLEAPPSTITLTFAEALDATKSSFKVVNAEGTVVARGAVAAEAPATMTATGLALEPGAYAIRWTAGADDGHLERGTTHFTVLAPTPAPATPAPVTPGPSTATSDTPAPVTAAPATDSPAPAASAPAAAPTQAPATDPAAAASTGDVLLPILAALVVLGVIGVLVLRRSRAA